MPPSPYKRDRRYKSRLSAGSDAERVSVRQRALEMASRGLNRRGGPVDKGHPDEQKAAAQRLRNDRAASLGDQQGRHGARPAASINRVRNRVMRTSTPESAGTGNWRGVVNAKRTTDNVNRPVDQARKPSGSTYDDQLSALARRRSTENRPKTRRRLFSRAG